MALTIDTINSKRKVPIKRNTKFFSGEDFAMEMDFMSEYMEQDANQTIILYQVDLEKTKVDDVYKEATKDNIRFKPPKELTCVYDLQDAEMKPYDNKVTKGVYAKPGKLTFSVLLRELEEKQCDISRGDYIGVQVSPEQRIYFVVNDDGRVQSFANKNTLYGTKAYYRTCTANYVDINEFNG